jgi:predicted phage-related endonuclease
MLTPEQRERRRQHLGASDAAAIVLGRDRWNKTPADIYWSKVGPAIPDTNTDATSAGNLIEPAIVKWCAEYLGVTPIPDQERVSAGGILAANFDALIAERPREAIEAKLRTPSDEWGMEATDEVEQDVLIQCQHQCYVGDLDRVWVPVLMLGHHAEFKLYVVKRNDDLIQEITQRELTFWEKYVVPKVAPDLSPPPLAALKALHRAPASSIVLPAEAVTIWEDMQASSDAINRMVKEKELRQRELLAMLGEAESGTLPDGRTLTYLLQNSAPSPDYVLLRANHPDIYDQFIRQGQHRVLRMKQPPKAKTGRSNR